MKLTILALASSFVLAAPALSQTIVRTLNGTVGAQLGRSVDLAGDWNNDGYPDLIVGCPFQAGVIADLGAVRIVSGKYLATGTGASTLLTRYGVNPGSGFGWSVLNVGDLNGDGKPEFLVGQPFYDAQNSSTLQTYADQGLLELIDGAFLNIIDTYTPTASATYETMQLGWSMAYVGDWDLDGVREVAVGSPSFDGGLTDRGRVWIFEVASSGISYETLVTGATTTEQFGYSLAAANLGVYGGIGNVRELIVGCPGYEILSTDQGRVQIYGKVPASSTPQLITSYSGDAGSQFGYCVDASADINGDGYNELVVGEPYADTGLANSGRVYVFNGSSLLPNAWFKSFTFDGGFSNSAFGASARGVSDINGDGVRDVIVGAPSVDAALPSDNYGRVYAYSGDTGVLLESQGGMLHQGLGRVIGPAVDFDGNAIAEWVACGPDSDNGGTNVGVLDVISTFPATPTTYCTGKTNSLGCVPAMSYSGAPSMSSAAAFTVSTAQLLNQRTCLHFYGFRPLGIPFQGGLQCVTSPSVRMAALSSGGSALPANDCTGVISYDYNAHIQSGIDPNLSTGQEVFVQAWGRDPAVASTTSLSNALRFTIAP